MFLVLRKHVFRVHLGMTHTSLCSDTDKQEACYLGYEPCHDKTCLWGFRPGLTQTIESGQRLEILGLASRGIVLSM